MRKKIVAGNWKMNGCSKENVQLATSLAERLQPRPKSTSVIVFPPFVHLAQIESTLADLQTEERSIQLGAQTLSVHGPGAHTGEISASMLKDIGCQYVLVGHSERRHDLGESAQCVAQQFVAAQQEGLVPMLCLGETLAEREADQTEKVIEAQLNAVLELASISAFADGKAQIAYEPVWAIGTGLTASPEQAQAVHAAIRQQLREHDATIAESVSILYGGSVKASNAIELFACDDIDGGLVGGASLDADTFAEIVAAND